MKLRTIILLGLVLALIVCSMNAAGHRMFVGQRMTVSLSAIYDDGEPAAGASVQVFRDSALFSENKTVSTGFFQMVLPGKGTGDWKFVVSGDGHEEATHFSIKDEGQATAATIAALFFLPAAWIWRRRGGR
jgi:hypothetical protein